VKSGKSKFQGILVGAGMGYRSWCAKVFTHFRA